MEALRERVSKSVKTELGKNAVIKRLSELDDIEEGKSVVVIGTLFKSQILKPNILKEVGEENAASNENEEEKEQLEKYIDDSDELVLEDDLQRARLYFIKDNKEYNVGQFVTGIVCGVLGSMIPSEQKEGGGKFRVEKMFFPALPEQETKEMKENSRRIAFVSGLNLSNSTHVSCLGSIDLAVQWILGMYIGFHTECICVCLLILLKLNSFI